MVSMCAIGDNVIDRYPQEQVMFPGGSAANAAVFASRLGVASSYIGILGSDAAAAFVAGCLEAEQVDISRAKHRDEPNSTTDVVLDPAGDRLFIDYVPPQSPLDLSADDVDFLRSVDWVHTGHSSHVEHELTRLAAVAPVSFDFSGKDLAYARDVLPHVTYATFSRGHASTDEAVELLRHALDSGVELAMVTRGAEGALAMTRDGLVEQPAQTVTAVDTIGAGDAFQTCAIAALTQGRPLADALALASAFAGDVCLQRGAFGHEAPLARLTTTSAGQAVPVRSTP